jgi:uncharacterized membrane protein HdeD (DUF308 family)
MLSEVMRTLADRWWLFALRGVAAILFALLCWFAPGASLVAIIALFAAYTLVDGVTSIAAGIRRRGTESWGWLIFHGVLSIAAAFVLVVWPGIGVLALVALIAVWSILTGASEIGVAIRLRRVIRGEWAIILLGIFSILFGVALIIAPVFGAVLVAVWIGTYAFLAGILSLVAAFHLRARAREGEISMSMPFGSTPLST